MAARAPLIEIFDSIQGEGRFVGQPMAFVRTATCPIRCRYCDTPHSYEAQPEFEVRGRRTTWTEPNPVTAERAVELVTLTTRREAWVASITGGEPLVFPDFVLEFAQHAHAISARVHLETAALDPDAMRAVVPGIDHVSADYKLPGTLEHGDYTAQNLACVETAVLAGCSVDVKAVLIPGLRDAAFDAMLTGLAPYRRAITLVLQPVTPFGAVEQGVGPDEVFRRLDAAAVSGFDVRVIPQVHRSLAVD